MIERTTIPVMSGSGRVEHATIYREWAFPPEWGIPPAGTEIRTWAVEKIKGGIEQRTKTGRGPRWLRRGHNRSPEELFEELLSRRLRAELAERAIESRAVRRLLR